jgi:hypothetical protein
MTNKQQDLVEHLVKIRFDLGNDSSKSSDIYKKISGMTAGDIIKCMEKANVIIKELESTPVGRELL